MAESGADGCVFSSCIGDSGQPDPGVALRSLTKVGIMAGQTGATPRPPQSPAPAGPPREAPAGYIADITKAQPRAK